MKIYNINAVNSEGIIVLTTSTFAKSYEEAMKYAFQWWKSVLNKTGLSLQVVER